MKIQIAGRDCTNEWGAILETEPRRMAALGECAFLPPEISALRLRGQPNHAAYLDALEDLVRRRHHMDTVGFRIPRKPGTMGAVLFRVRTVLWKLLRYQHDRMAFRQNQVNSNLMALLEMQGAELQELRKRLERVEERGS